MTYHTETVNNIPLKINEMLKRKLDFALKQQENDFDVVFLIDGDEGCGKSTFSFSLAWYLTRGKLTMDNIAEGSQDAIKKLQSLPDYSLLIIDEGSLTFSSRDTMKKENKQLLKILNVIRQKKMILIIVCPTFFELEKYLSFRRSRFLLHVYVDKKTGKRGKFIYFGSKKKKQLYIYGKKNFGSYAYPKSQFTGSFVDFKLPFEEEYQKLKRRSLEEAFDEKKAKAFDQTQIKEARKYLVLKMVRDNPDIPQRKIAEMLGINPRTLSRAIQGIDREKEEIPQIIQY